MSNAASILGYGAIGLGFLLAYLAYRLLLKEQSRDITRDSILRAIYIFEAFCVVLVVLGSVLQYSNNEDKAMAGSVSDKNKTIYAELESTKESLAAAQRRVQAAGACETSLGAYTSVYSRQSDAIKNANAIVDKVLGALSRQNDFAVNDSCSGGPHGIPTNHSADIQKLNASISSDVANVRGILSSAATINAPQ